MKIYVKDGNAKMKEASFRQMWVTFPVDDMVSFNASSLRVNVKEYSNLYT